jgi:hypothetical protein
LELFAWKCGKWCKEFCVFFCLVSQQIILNHSFSFSFLPLSSESIIYSDHSNSFRAKCKTTSANISVTKIGLLFFPRMSTDGTHGSIGGAQKKGLIFFS